VLQGIRKSRYVKSVQKFEFDPYLCDRSYLNDLRKICHRIRDVTWLNLVLRRVDFSGEIGILAPSLGRFLRLKSIRGEFPGTQNTSEEDFIQLYKANGNCSQLRFIEWKTIEMPEGSERLANISTNYFRRLKYLKSIKTYEALKKGALKNFGSNLNDIQKFRFQKIRDIDVTLSSAGEWASKEIMAETDKQTQLVKTVLKVFQHLERIRFCFIKKVANFEDLVHLLYLTAIVPSFSQIEYEFLNCQINDMEVFSLAHGLSKIKSLDYFALKVVQKPGISEDCIEKLAFVLSKLDNISKFDIYFRRLGIHPRAIQDLRNKIENFGNIQCICSKESIHMYRRSENI